MSSPTKAARPSWRYLATENGALLTKALTQLAEKDVEIAELVGQVEALRELLTNAVLLMRPGSDLCKRTLAALDGSRDALGRDSKRLA